MINGSHVKLSPRKFWKIRPQGWILENHSWSKTFVRMSYFKDVKKFFFRSRNKCTRPIDIAKLSKKSKQIRLRRDKDRSISIPNAAGPYPETQHRTYLLIVKLLLFFVVFRASEEKMKWIRAIRGPREEEEVNKARFSPLDGSVVRCERCSLCIFFPSFSFLFGWGEIAETRNVTITFYTGASGTVIFLRKLAEDILLLEITEGGRQGSVRYGGLDGRRGDIWKYTRFEV